jgi:mannonate dehydratase
MLPRHEKPEMSANIRVVAGQFRTPDDGDLTFARQMGLSGVTFNALDLDDTFTRRSIQLPIRPQGELRPYWAYDDLCRLREWVEARQMKIEALENVPPRMLHQLKTGGPRAAADIDGFCRTIENMGRAGIEVLGYNFMVLPVVRTDHRWQVRGGAASTSFIYAHGSDGVEALDPVNDDALWSRYETLLRAAIPVAESAGVRLALHPDDPPVAEIGGVARIAGTVANTQRALELVPSASHGLDFCVGSWAEAGHGIMFKALATFLAQNKIFYLHMRNVRAIEGGFEESFIDDGDVPMSEVVNQLHAAGFSGFVIDDHVPKMVGDVGWKHRGRAFATGYLRGLVDSVSMRQRSAL